MEVKESKFVTNQYVLDTVKSYQQRQAAATKEKQDFPAASSSAASSIYPMLEPAEIDGKEAFRLTPMSGSAVFEIIPEQTTEADLAEILGQRSIGALSQLEVHSAH